MIGPGENTTIGGTTIYVPVEEITIEYSGGSPGYSVFQDQLEGRLMQLQAELEAQKTGPISLTELEQRYLEQLNLELLYTQKAYFGFVNHLRRQYDAPESEWALNNINVGFERVQAEQ